MLGLQFIKFSISLLHITLLEMWHSHLLLHQQLILPVVHQISPYLTCLVNASVHGVATLPVNEMLLQGS